MSSQALVPSNADELLRLYVTTEDNSPLMEQLRQQRDKLLDGAVNMKQPS